MSSLGKTSIEPDNTAKYGALDASDPVIGPTTSSIIGLHEGPSLYAYVSSSPLMKFDFRGLAPNDKRYGLSKDFWRWYHREIKQPGDSNLDYPAALELFNEWCRLGKPGAK